MIYQMVKPLHIPPSKKWKGLTVFCNRCKSSVKDICRESGKSIDKCRYGDKHIFKVIIHKQGTRNDRLTKVLPTRDVNEAIKLAIEFESDVRSESFKNINGETLNTVNSKGRGDIDHNIPRYLIEALARYVGWLSNEGVPMHIQKNRSKEHIKDVERAFKILIEAIKVGGYKPSELLIENLNDHVVGHVYDHLLNNRKFSNRTFNKYFSHYSSFLKWYSEEYNIPIRNWFSRVKRKKINPQPETISIKEFKALLKIITPENGVKIFSKGTKPKRNVYRPWLKNGFKLALLTGRRREELVHIKCSDIVMDGDNEYILVEDLKTNRIQGRNSEEEKKKVFVPLTRELKQFLNELEFEKYKGMDRYLLLPEKTKNRKRVMCDALSRGFSHFYEKLNTGKRLRFRVLRKTYITHLNIFLKGNAKAITGHSSNAVIEDYYMNKKEIAKTASGFNILNDSNSRIEELENVRHQKNPKRMEVER